MKKLILLAITLIILGSCKKEKEQSRTATLICHSKVGRFVLKYHDDKDWHTDTIVAQNYSKSFQLTNQDMEWGQHIKSVLIPDSVYITGTIDGKRVESGYKSNVALIDISVQFSNAK